MNADEKYMKEAIRQAKKAYALEEVPIGCVIVYRDKIIGRGYNRRTIDKNPLAHAELTAIRKASKKLNDWRLEECTLYGHPGAMPDVLRRDNPGQGAARGSWMHESQGRLCGIHSQPAGHAGI